MAVDHHHHHHHHHHLRPLSIVISPTFNQNTRVRKGKQQAQSIKHSFSMATGNSTKTTPGLSFKTRLLIAVNRLVVDASRRSNGTINRRLINLLDPKAPPSTKPINGLTVTSTDVPVDPSRSLWFRLFVPTTDSPSKLPLIVYFHGGGFAFFAANSKPCDELCRRLAGELPAAVASVNYRLAPEHRFPSQYDDGFDALKFIDSQNHAGLASNADLTRCFIAGDSAGGNIAHHVTLRACQNSHEFETLKIIGLVAIQPFFGGEERTESELRLTRVPLVNVGLTDWLWRAFLPEGADRNHEAANVVGGGANSKSVDISLVRFPATILFVGGLDPVQDWQRKYSEWLKRGGKEVELIEYPNAIHAFYGFPELPESALFVGDVRDFIQKH